MSAPARFCGLHETAELVGRYRYVELAYAQLLGRRAAAGAVPFSPYLAGASGAHAWRAGLFEQHLPVSTGLPDAAALTVSPGADFDATLGSLEGLGDAVLVAACVGIVYPAMLEAWERHLALASPLSDAPLRRALRRAAADLTAVCEEGAALLGTGAPAHVPSGLGRRLSESGTFGRQVLAPDGDRPA